MSRSLVFVREAVPADAVRLAELWADLLRRGDGADHVADLTQVIEGAGQSSDQRLVVAEYDGRLAGAVHLRLTTITPLNLDLSVQVMSPNVFPEFRRHGVGRALMDAAVSWAEEHGAGHVATAAPVGLSRRQPLHGTPRARAGGRAADGSDDRRTRQADGPAAAGGQRAGPPAHARARRPPFDAAPGRRKRLNRLPR